MKNSRKKLTEEQQEVWKKLSEPAIREKTAVGSIRMDFVTGRVYLFNGNTWDLINWEIS